MIIKSNSNNGPRLRALQALLSPDDSRDEVLKKFVQLSSQTLGIPGSFISVLDDETQYVRASHNFNLSHSSRDNSLCRYVVDSDNPVVVPDTLLDMRFATHPLIIGAPYIRFYAGVPLKNSEGVVVGTLCVTDTQAHPFSASQITTLRMLAALVVSFLDALNSASFTDPVTALPNRQRFIQDLQNLTAASNKAPLRLIIIDCIDMPRAYELARSMGMEPVENLLKDVATLLPLRLRLTPDERLYTVATGRMAVLTRQDSHLSAAWIAEQLQGISADLGDGLSIALTIYTGELDFIPGEAPAQEVLRRALSALHEAIGRGLPSLRFVEAVDERRTKDFTLMNDLASALRGEPGLWIAYQPKICLHSGKPVGLEALIRWRHPLQGELSPASFVPQAEQVELLTALTSWITDRVVDRLARLRSSHIQLPITINISVRDFSHKNFALMLEDKMLKEKLPNALLGIECLETERILESPTALSGLDMLKRKGFTISLDDFGMGYSNISYLRRMPLDVIKLDRSLIRDISSDTSSRIIARSIISMLKELDYTVLAEGVEDEDVVTTLAEYGCDQAQGYFYSRPLPEAELDQWLAWRLRDQGK
ncbi:GGDEF and EAL domain-containing protein [Erwinia sp.]|uniref:EAL domain-containing protein n=1 Tax=Erwinia citreus TaxID=558 RepID=UPI00289C4625|nr:GGDEF and EAL domain-containing protein [Erwinia sp.]